MSQILLTTSDIENITEIMKNNPTQENIKKCLHDVEYAIAVFPDNFGLMESRIISVYQILRCNLVDLYEKNWGEYKPQVKNTIGCKIKFLKNNVEHSFYFKDLKRNEINYLNKRNSDRNIIKKLEIIKNAQGGDLTLLKDYERTFCSNDNDYGFLDELITVLTEIKSNRKIKVSKDFNFKIVVEVLE